MRTILTIAGLSFAMAAPLMAQPAPAPGAVIETQSAYLVRCKRETIAAWPGAAKQADSICASKWTEVVAAGPIADTLLALAPAPGAAFNPASVRARAAAMRGFTVSANRPPQPAGVTISWFRNGEPIPFNLEDALRGRGATLTMIACLSYGAGEGTRIWRAAAPGKAPFVLTVAFRNAAVASQSSDFSATGDYTSRFPTLTSLRRDGTEWTAACPA